VLIKENFMRLLRENTLALGIDYQEKLVPALSEQELFIRNSARLFEGLRELHVPVIMTEQYVRGLGPTVAEIKAAVGPDSAYLEKLTFSGWDTAAIRDAIKASGKKTVLLAGDEAHVCVMQTAIDLIAADYTVAVVVDCVASRTELKKRFGLKRLQQEGVYLTTYESILFELLRGSENPAFKAISKIVK
jgi:nicotinamidase-related amidase